MNDLDNMISSQADSDIRLLQLVKQNDSRAFEEIYNRYGELMFEHAYRVLRDREVCMDIVQDIFAWFWTNRAYLEISSIKPYLKSAVRFQVANFIRKSRVQDVYLKNFHEVSSSATVEEISELNELKTLIEDLTRLLPEKCRRVFEMSRKEYLSNKEISVKLGISEKTVEMHMTLALKRLRIGVSHYLHLLLIFF